jgi:hypothetical protein
MVQAIEFAIVKEFSVPRRGELASVGARHNLFNITDDHHRDGCPVLAGAALASLRRLPVQNRHNVSTLRLLVDTKDPPPGAIYLPG